MSAARWTEADETTEAVLRSEPKARYVIEVFAAVPPETVDYLRAVIPAGVTAEEAAAVFRKLAAAAPAMADRVLAVGV